MDLDKELKKIEEALRRYDERVKKAFLEYEKDMAILKEELRMRKLQKVRGKIYGNE